jgi:hypothetical protein
MTFGVAELLRLKLSPRYNVTKIPKMLQMLCNAKNRNQPSKSNTKRF